jgi:hypothetical protein
MDAGADVHQLTRDQYTTVRYLMLSEHAGENLEIINNISVSVFIAIVKENPAVTYTKYIDLFYAEATEEPNEKHELLYRALFNSLPNDVYDSHRYQLAKYALINRSKYWITDCLLDILTPEYIHGEYIFSEVYANQPADIANDIATKLMTTFSGIGLRFDITPCMEMIGVSDSVFREFCRTNTVITNRD